MKRAKKMVSFADPEKVFRKIGEGQVSGRHYVPEQGTVIKQMIMDEIRQLQDLPNLFVISSFSEIPSILKKELCQPIK